MKTRTIFLLASLSLILLPAAAPMAQVFGGVGVARSHYSNGVGYYAGTTMNGFGVQPLTVDSSGHLVKTGTVVEYTCYQTLLQDYQWVWGTVLLNGKIYIFYPNAWHDNNGWHWNHCRVDYVAYDIATNTIAYKGYLGQVDNPATGIAAAIINGQIHVFTDGATFTSPDGSNWTVNPAIYHDTTFVPLDATAIYPSNNSGGASALILFEKSDRTLLSCVWNGKYGTDSVTVWKNLPFPALQGQHGQDIPGHAILMPGTANNDSSHSTGLSHGAIRPVVQCYAADCKNYRLLRAEYDIEADIWTQDPYYGFAGHSSEVFWACPWYEPAGTSGRAAYTIKQSHEFLVFSGSSKYYGRMLSDFALPLNQDLTQNGYGWLGTPTSTFAGTADDLSILRKHWSLVGVILGPPPFATNDMEDPMEIKELSNVIYGLDSSHEISHKDIRDAKFCLSTQTEMKFGIEAKGMEAGFGLGFDFGMKQGWEHITGKGLGGSKSVDFKMGTTDEGPGIWGHHGWAIFNAPILVNQDYELYGYDLNTSTFTGTYLNQDMYIITCQGMEVQTSIFDLTNPGGPDDDVPGLMSGMRTYPYSTDLEPWSNYDSWEAGDPSWVVLFGTGAGGGGSITPLIQGTQTTAVFTANNSDVDSKGGSTTLDVGAGFSMKAGTKLSGFKETVKASFEGTYAFETEDKTTLTSSLTCELHMPLTGCEDVGCTTNMHIQPYILKAVTPQAPWIPSAFAGSLPWCMTWWITNYNQVDYKDIGPVGPPDNSKIDVNNGGDTGESSEEAGQHNDSISLEGGNMEWIEGDGLRPIPIGASQFDPSKGAVVKIAEHLLKADETNGKWKQKGSVWTFSTKASAKNEIFTLKLDFGTLKWDLEGKKLDLSSVRAGDTSVFVELAVHDRYIFKCRIEHEDAELTFKAADIPQQQGPLVLESIEGSYLSDKEKGVLQLKGRLEKHALSFGDVSLIANGRRKDMRITGDKHFIKALNKSGVFTFEAEGVDLKVDFAAGRWSLKLSKGHFEPTMRPSAGGLGLSMLIGGRPWLDSKLIHMDKYSSKLKHKS